MSEVRAPLRGLAAGAHVLPADLSRYLCVVRRLRRGDTFLAFDPEARIEADATIDDDAPGAARVTVGELRPASVVATAPLVLVHGLAKGEKIDAVVRDATELGATHVVLARTSRSVVRIDDARASAKGDRWRRIAEQAARQCGRADPPVVDVAPTFSAALQRAAAIAEARFVLDPHAVDPLGPPLAEAVAKGAAIAFAVGPEGGFSPEDLDAARAAGFSAVQMGPFVLRTETVAAAVLGAVRILTPT